MRAVLRIELIGDDFFWHQRRNLLSFDQWLRQAKRFGYDKSNSWVARITGLDEKYGFKREFLRPTRDYSQANSTGSRGIFAYYILPSGIYEVNHRESWKRIRRYFCRVEGTEIIEISKDEVIQCLI